MAEEEPKPPAEDPQLKELQAEEEKARAAIVDATFAWGDAKRRLGYYQGYSAGREAAKETFTNFLRQMAAEADAEKAAEQAKQSRPYVPPTGGRGATLLTGLINTPPPPSPKEIVVGTIKANPGLRGAQLLRKIHETHPLLHERTFRTSLHRLRVPTGQPPRDGQLVSFERRWYVYPDVPDEAKPPLQRVVDNLVDAADKIVQAAKGNPPNPKDNGGQQ
jgi:hypothetical protein